MTVCSLGNLVRFFEKRLSNDEEWEVLNHISQCRFCSDLLRDIADDPVRADLIFPLPIQQSPPPYRYAPNTTPVRDSYIPGAAESIHRRQTLLRSGTLASRMAEHLRTTFPAEWGSASDTALSEFVLSEIERAGRYGVDSEDDVGLYLELATVYGADFDISPQTAWAGEILRRRHLTGPEKMDCLESYEIFKLPHEDSEGTWTVVFSTERR